MATLNINNLEKRFKQTEVLKGINLNVEEGDFLYTDIPENDFKKLKELKKHLSKMEIEVLKEVAEIKRKDNPVWGVG